MWKGECLGGEISPKYVILSKKLVVLCGLGNKRADPTLRLVAPLGSMAFEPTDWRIEEPNPTGRLANCFTPSCSLR